MIEFLQWIFSGVLLGLLYSMIALGLIVVYRSGRIVNLAQGELVVLGGFLTWWFAVMSGLPLWLGVIIAFGIMALLGVLVERGVFRPLIGEPMFALVMMTIGLLLFLRGLVLVIWGGQPQAFPAILPTELVVLGPFGFAPAMFWGGLLSLAVTVALIWFFERTRWGLRLSVVAEDQVVAQSMGVSVKLAVGIAWVIAMLLGGLGAIVFCNDKTLTFLASEIGFRALPVALLGGMESVRGAPLAGLMIGISEMLARGYIDPLTGGGMSAVMPYIIMIIVVLIRPQGLFGWRIIERV